MPFEGGGGWLAEFPVLEAELENLEAAGEKWLFLVKRPDGCYFREAFKDEKTDCYPITELLEVLGALSSWVVREIVVQEGHAEARAACHHFHQTLLMYVDPRFTAREETDESAASALFDQLEREAAE